MGMNGDAVLLGFLHEKPMKNISNAETVNSNGQTNTKGCCQAELFS